MDNNLATYARRFFSGTLLSRISGMGRDLAMAFAFGDHPSVAAFMVAFRFSNLFRRLLGEGPLQSAFIPHFESLRVENESRASFFFRKLVILITVIALTITCLAEAGLVASLYYLDMSPDNQEIVRLTAWLFPGLLFICLYGLNISLLNCYDSFFIPSVAPFICNIIWITAALLLFGYDTSSAMESLSKWVVIGFVAQWLLTLPLTWKYVKGALKDWVTFTIPVEVKDLFKAFSMGAIGVGAVQINALADAFFARYADLRGPTYLWYSIRLEQLALAVFGIACVTTIAPRLSRAIKSSSFIDAQHLFSLGYQRIMSIMVPCTFAIGVTGLAAVNLVYGRGHFSDEAVWKTFMCLFAYGVGLVPTTLILLYSTLYYAKSDFKTPMVISVLSVMLNILMNYIFVFVFHWGAVSTALSTSLSALFNCMLISHFIKNSEVQVHYSGWRVLNIFTASVIASFCAMMVAYVFFGISIESFVFGSFTLPHGTSAQAIFFGALATAFLVGFMISALLFKNEDVLGLFKTAVHDAKA